MWAKWRELIPKALALLAVCLAALLPLLKVLRYETWFNQFVFVGFVLSIAGAVGFEAVNKLKREALREAKIEAVERKVQENPKAPQLAWELAQVKLESYLNRNLSQVRSIFLLTVCVMVGGFSLITVGAYEAFRDPGHFQASVLSSVSGVVVSFIGGTFLVLYKSTMAQAKDYVTILERINAVGMSVQILESLNTGDEDLKHETIAAVARQLLYMYSRDMPEVTVSRKKRGADAADPQQVR